jgi:two-component system, chemotaxis family, sensor kinase Cph1
VSIATVIALIRYFNEAVGLRTSREYERELVFRQQAEQELSRSNEELQQFAYVASHDLQSPLKTIINYLDLLERNHGDQLDTEGHKLLHTTSAAATRMRTLINDLLDFSRVGANMAFTAVNLNELVTEILEEQQPDIQATKAVVEVGNLPIINAQRTDIKQVFSNLISNALKYHRPGVAPNLSIRASDEGDAYCFGFSDNGIGIAPQHYDRVFQVFQRLHGRNEYPGTGIGLATCKKLIDIYGGKIWIDSKPGIGSTFYLTIPKEIRTVKHYAQTQAA